MTLVVMLLFIVRSNFIKLMVSGEDCPYTMTKCPMKNHYFKTNSSLSTQHFSATNQSLAPELMNPLSSLQLSTWFFSILPTTLI